MENNSIFLPVNTRCFCYNTCRSKRTGEPLFKEGIIYLTKQDFKYQDPGPILVDEIGRNMTFNNSKDLFEDYFVTLTGDGN